MTEKSVKPVKIKDPLHVPTTFVNQMVGNGFLNGVVNLTFATAEWMPEADGTVSSDLTVSARLRMDLFCAQTLHAALGKILEQNVKPANGTSH